MTLIIKKRFTSHMINEYAYICRYDVKYKATKVACMILSYMHEKHIYGHLARNVQRMPIMLYSHA